MFLLIYPALLILSIVAPFINAQESLFKEYNLIIHDPRAGFSEGHILANVSIDSSNLQANINAQQLVDLKNNNELGWCMSLVSKESPSLKCFNYMKSFNQVKTNSGNTIKGDLLINLNNDFDITSANYYSVDNGKLSLKIQPSFKLAEPQPRLKLPVGGANDLSIGDIEEQLEIESKENANGKGKKDNKKDTNKKIETTDDDMEDFEEVVKPKGIYSNDKTFIETYWMYIFPPMIAFFIFGQMGLN